MLSTSDMCPSPGFSAKVTDRQQVVDGWDNAVDERRNCGTWPTKHRFHLLPTLTPVGQTMSPCGPEGPPEHRGSGLCPSRGGCSIFGLIWAPKLHSS